MSEQRVLPADEFDALELSVMAFKGVGQPNVFTDISRFGAGPSTGSPVCILGHAAYLTDTDSPWNSIGNALYKIGIRGSTSDAAVRAINARKRVSQYARVSWKEYTHELNIVRGD